MTTASKPPAQCLVLVVDDDDGVRETLREVIEMAGCRAELATNGAEGLALLQGIRPCLIVLDLMMPVMNGSAMLKALRAEPSLASLPVVISTSAPNRAPAGVPVLSKPINIDALWACIRKACPNAENASEARPQ